MKLRQLDAAFVGDYHEKGVNGAEHTGHRQLPTVEGAQGVMFQCPKCAQGKERGEEDGRQFVRGAHSVICWFANPRNAPRVPDHADPKPGRWYFSGETLDTLTFTGPGSYSVLLKSGCEWHGYVRDGEATLS